MKQRSFPWLQSLAAPSDAPVGVVAQLAENSFGLAARISLQAKPGGPWSQRWLAKRLHIKPPYLNRILHDEQPMPEWMRLPIAWATGSRLILQYAEMQERMRVHDSERGLIQRLAEQIRRAA